ncbi:endonuclease/exonuclease/phosphatase family protein [Bacteroidota bacterium]
MRTLILLLLICSIQLSAQEERGDLRFVFYNVENLFDPFDDSLKHDDEFLPGAERHWTWERFLDKEQKVYKVLVSAGGWKPAELIGLCEVENRFVLNWLVRKTPLLKYNYKVIHQDSPDERGIDVAFLYQPSKFRVLDWRSIPVGYFCRESPCKEGFIKPAEDGQKASSGADPEVRSVDFTRDILYIRGTAMERDTIHIVICHWPSRWEGYLESLPNRLEAAQTLKCLVDSIWSMDRHSSIIVAGDLNDELTDPSLSTILRVRNSGSNILDTCLYDTGGESTPPGTLKYRGRWYEFDHILVSGGFITDSVLHVREGGKKIHAPDFLFEKDPVSPGKRPYRTFNAYRYSGGFSDHLPVYIDLWQK